MLIEKTIIILLKISTVSLSTNIKLQNIVVSGGTIKNGGTGDINVNNASITCKKNINENERYPRTRRSNYYQKF